MSGNMPSWKKKRKFFLRNSECK